MNDFMPFVVIGLVSGSVYGLAGMGLVLTYKTSGIFNFAHGAIAAVVAYVFFDLRESSGWPWPLAAVVCLVVVTPIVALVLERLARRLTDAPVATKIVATLGLLIMVQQLVIIRYGAETIPVDPFLPTGSIRMFSVNVEIGQLIVMGVALAGAIGLSIFLRTARLGRAMRGVVDNADLLTLTGTNPTTVRRWAWYIGSGFAGLSGVLFAPAIGLDANILTLLVVQAFGAAAIGLFTSLPLTYAGGLLIGVLAALSTKYVGDIRWLGGLPPSLPFVALFAALVFTPRRRLVQVTAERRRRAVAHKELPAPVKAVGGALGLLVLVLIPELVGVRLTSYTTALAFVIIFLSLALLERTSGQVSLAQLSFAAVGAAWFSKLAHDAGLPWLLAVVLAALITVPVGAIVAIPAIRLYGLYLALATLGFGLLLENLISGTVLMFGGGRESVVTPRPSFATSDQAYYYVVLGFLLASLALVVTVHRSRLGRFLRAMADSPVGLLTYGTNLNVLKLAVFCISAFLAGLGGALLGPVTGRATPVTFGVFASLLLVVVLALQGPVDEYRASFAAAVALVVVPSYLTSETAHDWLPVVFGGAAIAVSLYDARAEGRTALPRAHAAAEERVGRSPAAERIRESVASGVAP